jgi:hypothetical protein
MAVSSSGERLGADIVGALRVRQRHLAKRTGVAEGHSAGVYSFSPPRAWQTVLALRQPDAGKAWERFAALYTPLLYHGARRVAVQDSDAADVAQDVLLHLYQSSPDFAYDPHRSFRAWLRLAAAPKAMRGQYNGWEGGRYMLKAMLRNGAIIPLEPVPPDWEEGTTLEVVRAAVPSVDLDAWAKLMDQLCADSPPEEEQRMQAAIDAHRRQAKAQSRRKMGLPE